MEAGGGDPTLARALRTYTWQLKLGSFNILEVLRWESLSMSLIQGYDTAGIRA